MSAKVKHLHRLKKHKYSNGTAIFFCTLEDCGFKVETALSLGKRVICNSCQEPFIMNEYSVRLTRPHCNNCGKRQINVDGKKVFVNKRTPMVAIAEDEVTNLRDRLNSLTGDEDI